MGARGPCHSAAAARSIRLNKAFQVVLEGGEISIGCNSGRKRTKRRRCRKFCPSHPTSALTSTTIGSTRVRSTTSFRAALKRENAARGTRLGQACSPAGGLSHGARARLASGDSSVVRPTIWRSPSMVRPATTSCGADRVPMTAPQTTSRVSRCLILSPICTCQPSPGARVIGADNELPALTSLLDTSGRSGVRHTDHPGRCPRLALVSGADGDLLAGVQSLSTRRECPIPRAWRVAPGRRAYGWGSCRSTQCGSNVPGTATGSACSCRRWHHRWRHCRVHVCQLTELTPGPADANMTRNAHRGGNPSR
jgi:hypothetical protein